MEKTRIILDEREMKILLSWVFGDFKPTNWHEVDIQIVKKLKRACSRLMLEEEFEEYSEEIKKEYDADGLEISKEMKEEFEKNKKEIASGDGIFYCPNCQIRTNQKTPTTSCVLCGAVLVRMGA